MTGAIRFTPLPNDRVRADPVAVAATQGLSLLADRPTYAWPQVVWDQIDHHARSSRKEVAGVLAGRVWTDGSGLAFVSVEVAIPADWGVDTSATHVSFRPEAWDRIGPTLRSLPNEPVVVGWYHSHPGLSAFFSGTDRDTQAGAFRESWQIGVVVDPIRRERQAYRGPWSEPVDLADIVEVVAPIVEGRLAPEARAEGTHDRMPGDPSKAHSRIMTPVFAIRTTGAALLAVVVVVLAVRRARRK